MFEDTIVSQATPVGHSAIAIIRISGKMAFEYAKRITRTKKNFKHLRPKHLPIYINRKRKIDSGIFIPFFSPRSYDGENIIEISCHGNPFIIGAIIDEFLKYGARIAKPGEYTKRAFLNNKLDLNQAESVGLLIQSKSLEAAEKQTQNLDGNLSLGLNTIRNEVVSALALLEYEFDVSEIKFLKKKDLFKIKNNIKNCEKRLSKIIGSFNFGSAYSKGLRFVFVGKANVGKSTLINTLLNYDRIITNNKPGTTRDVITVETIFKGVPVTLIDTAGINRTNDPVELQGIEKTKEEISRSDVIFSLFAFDAQPVDFIADKHTINIYNKNDLAPYRGNKKDVISISALSGDGIDTLKQKINKSIKTVTKSSEPRIITTIRQKDSLTRALKAIKSASTHFKQNPAQLELIASDLRSSLYQFDITSGKTITNEVLESVFSSFCVGK